MKKLFGIFVLSMIFISMGIVSAASDPVDAIGDFFAGAKELVTPVLEAIVGDVGTDGLFLAKIMFMIVIFAIIWKSLEKIPFFSGTPWVLWVVTIAVSILSVRFVGNADFIETILLPYSALGIALTAGIPFVIYFLVTIDLKRTARKMSWVFFIVIFVALWIARLEDIEGSFKYIYLITALLGFAVLIFDGTIHKIKNKIKAEKGMSYKDLERKHRVLDELEEARDTRVKMISRGETTTKIKALDDHIKTLEKSIARYA